MKKLYIYLKSNFFKIFFFSFFFTVISFFYEHYGWAMKDKIYEELTLSFFSIKEEGSILCGGLPLPYAFETSPIINGFSREELSYAWGINFYWNIFIIDVILWMFILTLLFSWLKEFKSKKISKKEDKK